MRRAKTARSKRIVQQLGPRETRLVALGNPSDLESADVVRMKSDAYDIGAAIELSRATLRKMYQNLWWAVGEIVTAFPLVAGVLYPFVLSSAIAALSMLGSSAVVAINAPLLKRTKLASTHRPGKPCKVGRPALAATAPADQKAAA